MKKKELKHEIGAILLGWAILEVTSRRRARDSLGAYRGYRGGRIHWSVDYFEE